MTSHISIGNTLFDTELLASLHLKLSELEIENPSFYGELFNCVTFSKGFLDPSKHPHLYARCAAISGFCDENYRIREIICTAFNFLFAYSAFRIHQRAWTSTSERNAFFNLQLAIEEHPKFQLKQTFFN